MRSQSGDDDPARLRQIARFCPQVHVVRPTALEPTKDTLECRVGLAVVVPEDDALLLTIGPKQAYVVSTSGAHILAKQHAIGLRDDSDGTTLLAVSQMTTGPTEAEFIVSLVVVGVLGPALAVLAARWSDRRRFTHERKLKASDDLVGRIDDVAGSFDELNAACAEMRLSALFFGPEQDDTLKAVQRTEAAHLRTRALSSRLGMRPHADSALVESAFAAATSMYSAIENVRIANLRRHAIAKAVGGSPVLQEFNGEVVEEHLATGLRHQQEFEAEARVAIGKLLA
jgi:hypothetical protein